LGVNYSASGGHPLNVSSLQLSFVSLGIFMTKTPRQHICHCFEAAMWMIGSSFCFSWSDDHRAHLIKQQKWIEIRQRIRRKWPVDQEPCAFQCRDAFYDTRHGTGSHDGLLFTYFK